MRHRFLAACLLAACGSPSELKIAAPATALADGSTAVSLQATAKFRGVAVSDNTDIAFSTDVGSFDKTQATTQKSTHTAGGIAQITLYPPPKPATAHLGASFINVNGETVQAKATLEFVASAPADASTIAFSCAQQNVGALIAGAPEITVACSLVLKDVSGKTLGAGTADFYAETGSFVDQGDDASGVRQATLHLPPGSAPVDVVPDDAENAVSYLVANPPHNPRDGLATLLAVVRAAEAFTDSNGNGVFDDGEPYVDEGEPFLDVDDDGIYDPTIDKFLIDLNHDGTWTAGNGQYDKDTKVGRSVHLLLSGDPTVAAVPQAVNGPQSVRILIVDQNGNPPATFDANDKIHIALSGSSSGLQLTPAQVSQSLSSSLLMSFGPDGSFSGFAHQPDGTLTQREYDIGINDTRTSGAPALSTQLTASVNYTPWKGASGRQQSVAVSITFPDPKP